jgi:ABC-2 type transport system permease protein
MNLALKYKKSFLEKLLGTNYKWWYLVKYVLKLNTYYLWNEIFSSVNKAVILLASLIIFTTIQQESSEVVTYLILGNLFFIATDPNNSWLVGESIKDGSLVRVLLQPVSVKNYFFVNGFATVFYMLFSYAISFAPVILLFWNQVDLNLNILWLIPFWPIAVLIRSWLDIITGLTAFWSTEFYGAAFLNQTLTAFFSGSMFPLIFLSEQFPILNYTPFAFILNHPMQIYLGNYTLVQTGWTLLGGIIWAIILWLAARILFRLGLKKNESVGL